MVASGYRGSERRRPLALLLALAAHVLLFLILIGLAPKTQAPPPSDSRPVTFSMYPADRDVEKPSERKSVTAQKKPQQTAAAAARPTTPTPEPPPVPPPPTPPAPSLFGDKSLFAAGDISNMGHADQGEGDSEGDAKVASTYGPGEGPGGAKLFNAEWYTEPPRGVLTAYMPPAGAPAGSWAMVACRTIPDFRVDNCRSLGESPMGSGLARALREAAWQFRVRPPRVGGKMLVGAWVRIRFDFTAGGEAVARRRG